MLAKLWKKIGLIILIVACLINISFKLASKISFDDAITEIKYNFSEEKTSKQNNQK